MRKLTFYTLRRAKIKKKKKDYKKKKKYHFFKKLKLYRGTETTFFGVTCIITFFDSFFFIFFPAYVCGKIFLLGIFRIEIISGFRFTTNSLYLNCILMLPNRFLPFFQNLINCRVLFDAKKKKKISFA